MKRKAYFPIVMLLSMSLLLSCEKKDDGDSTAPEACFIVEGDTIAGEELMFDATCSKNAVTYAWDFGDGNTSSMATPNHTYTTPGTYIIELTITNENELSHSAMLELSIAQPAILEHRGTISQDETWAEGIHLITGDVYVENATLTIDPGAIVKFTQGTGLYIAYGSNNNGQLMANGLADKGILFTSAASSPSVGDWDYLWFDGGTSDASSLTYCTFEYGGGYSSSYGMVHLRDSEVNFNNCTFRYSASKGISLGNEAAFKSFADNSIKNNSLNPIEIYANHAHTIGINNDIESTTGILIRSDQIDQGEVIWNKQTVPYYINGDVDVGSITGSILNIEAGTTLAFAGGSELSIGNSSSTFGTLNCAGTAAEPITFTSASASKSEGDWDFVWFGQGASSSSSLDYCVFEYGGGYSDNYGMIHLEDCFISITNSIVRNSQSYGISADSDAGFVAFSNNTVVNNTSNALRMYGNYVHTIGENNSITSAKGIRVENDYIEVEAGTWAAQETYYLIIGELRIGSESGSTITLEPGTELRFSEGAAMMVGYGTNRFGNLIADGTESAPIIFTTASPSGSESPGDWDYIWFDQGIGASTILDNCEIRYGGGYNTNYGAIHCNETGNGRPVISNTKIAFSDSYGISMDDSAPQLTNITYESNAQANEYTY